MKKEIIKNEDNTEVVVLIELKKRIMARDPKMTFTTRMVKAMLENDKISVDKCVIHDTIDNNSEMSKRSGKWVFSLTKKERTTSPSRPTSKKKKNRTSKPKGK